MYVLSQGVEHSMEGLRHTPGGIIGDFELANARTSRRGLAGS